MSYRSDTGANESRRSRLKWVGTGVPGSVKDAVMPSHVTRLAVDAKPAPREQGA